MLLDLSGVLKTGDWGSRAEEMGRTMGIAMDRVVDALDVETFLACSSEEEAKSLAECLIEEMRLAHGDIVFLEFLGWGARVRIRTYVHHPGDHYRWLEKARGAA